MSLLRGAPQNSIFLLRVAPQNSIILQRFASQAARRASELSVTLLRVASPSYLYLPSAPAARRASDPSASAARAPQIYLYLHTRLRSTYTYIIFPLFAAKAGSHPPYRKSVRDIRDHPFVAPYHASQSLFTRYSARARISFSRDHCSLPRILATTTAALSGATSLLSRCLARHAF